MTRAEEPHKNRCGSSADQIKPEVPAGNQLDEGSCTQEPYGTAVTAAPKAASLRLLSPTRKYTAIVRYATISGEISYPAADYRCNRKSQISASDRQEIPQFIALDEIGLAGQSVHEGRLNRQGKTGKRSQALI